MSTYAWIITFDHLEDEATDIAGPFDATDEQVAALKAGEGTAFRMYDDDGELYYSGRFMGDPTEEAAFAPLEDYGTPAAGCTEIRYWEPGHGGEWKTRGWKTL